jgi:hypothetical protein
MPDDLGPCQTCPRATGVLMAPTGLYHICQPEEWQVCNVLYHASKAVTGAALKTRRRSRHLGWALSWQRLIFHLMPARHPKTNCFLDQ